MAQPSDRSKQKTTPPLVPEGLVIDELRYKPFENALEKRHRIWKDKWSFLVNDILSTFMAFAILSGIVAYSFWSLTKADLAKDDRRFAMSILTSAGTAVVGFVFGKAKK